MMRWILRVLLLSVVLTTVGAVALVIGGSRGEQQGRTEAIVVLGSAQFDGRPQPVFQARLQHTAKVYASNGGVIFTVGGKRPGDRFTEAEAGKRFLVRDGVKSKSVVAVKTGSDTWESMVAVAAEMNKRELTSITVVSDPAHVARCRAMLQHLGVHNVQVSPTSTGAGSRLTPRYLVRETLGLMHFWIAKDWFR